MGCMIVNPPMDVITLEYGVIEGVVRVVSEEPLFYTEEEQKNLFRLGIDEEVK